ncbi:MAG: MATE family efflux transporter [Candidatus Cloacimonadaceae bacterium]|nr:MATE family efflux transporter [Candidatus Cloacimonadota bacterium]MDX9949431.1 MATE family efflux transporter [Candidatus Syntrophosphaera sp.]
MNTIDKKVDSQGTAEVYENPLGVEKTSVLLREFSIPAIVGMMVSALYNVVDRIYIGNAPDIGSQGLAGITIGFPIMILQLAIALLFGIGGATLFAIKLGEKKLEEADGILGNTFALLLISGFLFMLFGISFHKPLLRLFGASENVLPYAMDYMRIIFFGSMFHMTSLGMNHMMRANGKPNLAMITMFAGAGTNIILDPIFIFGFKMGIAGAAWATIISQAVSMTWVVGNFLRKKNRHRIQFRLMKLRWSNVRRIAALGTPSFVLQSTNSVLHVILNQSLFKHGGDIAISAMGIVNSVQTILLMPITGLNQGLQTIISFNFGARKYDRIKQAERQAMTVATIIVVVGWMLTRLFPTQIVSMFNRESELLKLGSYALKTWFWMLPVVGFQILGANFFQAIGRPLSAMTLTLTRQVLLLIPAIIVFSRLWGLEGLLFAAPFADGLAAVITGLRFRIGIRSLGQEVKESKFLKA